MKNIRTDIKRDGVRGRIHLRADMQGQVIIHDGEKIYIAPLSNLSAGGVFIGLLDSLPGRTSSKISSEIATTPRADPS